MGYALRHVAELEVTFLEFARVLKPGGRLLILEISRPRSLIARSLLQLYLGRVLPLVVRMGTGHRNAELLVKYYWETIAECVPVEKIVEIVQASGFVEVEHLDAEVLGEEVVDDAGRELTLEVLADDLHLPLVDVAGPALELSLPLRRQGAIRGSLEALEQRLPYSG